MKTLILNGSPRKNGDTVSLINELTRNLHGEYKIVDAYYCEISPCIDCRYCWENNVCAIDDEMQNVYDYINDCDNVIIASPIYFSELTGKLLDLCSRFQTYFTAKYFRNETLQIKDKKGAVILVGGGDGDVNKAYGTAKCVLKHINVTEIYPLVYCHNTNNVPAVRDENVLLGISEIADFLNLHIKPDVINTVDFRAESYVDSGADWWYN